MLTRGLKFLAPRVSNCSMFRAFADFPLHEALKMPALSPTMSEGTIVKWFKKEGEKVKAGEVMFEVETDKATVGYEVQDDVFIAKILAHEGSAKIPLGQVVAILVNKADRISAFKDYTESSEKTPTKPIVEKKIEEVKETTSEKHIETTGIASETSRKFISPIAKVLAKENGIDYKELSGSGPNGRILKSDVLSAASNKLSEKPSSEKISTEKPVLISEDRAGYTDIPHSSMRKTIAKRLLESKQQIPHFYLTIDCKMNNLMELRKELNEISDVKISVNDLVIKAAALALAKVPEVNSSWTESAIRTYSNVDISVAVQTPKGLITPIVKNADIKRLGEIAKEVKDLANTAKEGKLKPEQYIGGTFTISNLGMFGVKEFSAIINPPQAAILAVGTSEDRVVPNGSGFEVKSFMTVTMSCDHRVINGAVGANWLKVFKQYLEQPKTMLI